MRDYQDDQEVGLMVISTETEHVKAPLAKKRRLEKPVDKQETDSSFDPTRPFAKFFTNIVAAEKAKTIEVIKARKHKAPKTMVPFYYDEKTFSISASHGFVKLLEKEN